MTDKKQEKEPAHNWWGLAGFVFLLASLLAGGVYYASLQKERELTLRAILAQELIVISTMRLSHRSSNEKQESIVSESMISDIREICGKNKDFFQEVSELRPTKSDLIQKFINMCSTFDSGISRGSLTYAEVQSASDSLSEAVSLDIAGDEDNIRHKNK